MSVLQQIGTLFILMALGFALRKLKVVGDEALKGLSNLIVKAALPALLITSLQRPFSADLLSEALTGLATATVFYMALIALSYLAVKLLKTPPRQVGALVFSLAFSNSGFVGFPVVASILGKDALFSAAIHNILFNLFAFSVGIAIVSSGGSSPTQDGSPAGSGVAGSPVTPSGAAPKRYLLGFPLKRLLSVNVVAATLGFILFIRSVNLPPIIKEPLLLIGGTTVPLAMIVVGLMLARTPFRAVVGNWRLYVVAGLRLAVWPFLAYAACTLAGLSAQLTAITVIMAGMPAASNTSLIAEVYGGDAETASAVIFITTALSVASIPLLALLLV